MAILWERRVGGHLYQVRQAGKSLRLYTDDIFHTQYRPDRVLGGGYWDLLTLPALMYPVGHIRRVLVLGVGGGAVIHGLRALVSPRHITAVELDPTHIQITKRFFGLGRGLGARQAGAVKWKVMDARDFIRAYRGPAFDLIIEDLYFERNGGAVRAVVMDKAWMKALQGHLTRDGMLVCNFPDRREFRASLNAGCRWESIYSMTLPAYENQIGVFTRSRELMTDIPAVLRRKSVVDKRIPSRTPRFQIKQERS